jgi:alpha-D-ribose 1-methylphosphonate 5-triphosphate diphosphatase
MLIKNARIVMRDEVVTGAVCIRDGLFNEIQCGATAVAEAIDWNGDYLLPGLVELHTDNLEKHVVPRAGVTWNAEAAVIAHDMQIATAGITTVLNGIAIGSRSSVGSRNQTIPLSCTQALLRLSQRNLLRAEHFLHLRCEVATPDVVEVFDLLKSHPLLRLCSVMDHTPGQGQWHDVAHWRRFKEHEGKLSDQNFRAIVDELSAQHDSYADRNRLEIVSRCQTLAVPLASHDDSSTEHVERAKSEGIVLAEFPTTHIAAATARAYGIGTVLGAPNLVRGVSHSGNVSALDLARANLVDILSSDYVPSSLLTAAFELTKRAGWTLPKAISAVSEKPARFVGLKDRGAVAVGFRADFSRVAMLDRLPLVREVFRMGSRIA